MCMYVCIYTSSNPQAIPNVMLPGNLIALAIKSRCRYTYIHMPLA